MKAEQLQATWHKRWGLVTYKLLGFTTSDWLTYEDYPIRLRFSPSGVRILEDILIQGGAGHYYFYDSNSRPLKNAKNLEKYLERLGKIMRLKVK